MAFVLALVGGAAAVEIGRLLNKDNNKPSSKELEALQSKEEELQQTLQDVQAELQQEKAAHEVDQKRVQELSAVAEQLQIVKADLEQESTALRSDKQSLLHKTQTLEQQHTELCESTDKLRVENTTLALEVKKWKQASEDTFSSLTKKLERIKSDVVKSVHQFAHGQIDSTELLQSLHDLGVEVNISADTLDALPDIRPGLKDMEPFEEQVRTDFSKQMRLISDSPERLGMLLASVNAAADDDDDAPGPSSRVPALSFPTLKSPPKERQGSQVFNFLSAVGLTPRKQESSQSKVPALNLSSVGYKSPAKSPDRALQPTTVNNGSGTALVFSKAKKESKKGSKYTVNLGGPSAERKLTPRALTPRRSRSNAGALDFHDRENQEPYNSSSALVPR